MGWYQSHNHALAAIDPVVEALTGKYTAYQLAESEYVRTINDSLENVTVLLKKSDYERNALAAAKYHHEPHKALDHGSYRRVPQNHPDALENQEQPAEIVNHYEPEECQYHVHLWPTADGVELYSHYEVRPDLWPVADESPLEAYQRAREHYDPTAGETYVRGVSDLQV